MGTQSTLPRLHTTFTSRQKQVCLEGPAVHYLVHVMRRVQGDQVRLFNAQVGEWLATIIHCQKKRLTLTLEKQLRPPNTESWLPSLAFAPLKQDAMNFLLEKTAELGISTLYPVLTAQTHVRKINTERLCNRLVEATEQSEQFQPPLLKPLQPLQDFLDEGVAPILWACEKAAPQKKPLYQACAALEPKSGPPIFLVGPEGGFSGPETAFLSKHSRVYPISLGPTILRAETAAIKMLACYHALMEAKK